MSIKQLQRTVIPNRWRAASASFHCAHATRWKAHRAVAEPGRYAAQTAFHNGNRFARYGRPRFR